MVNEELRSSLHKRLDDLLDKRSSLEPDEPLNTLGRLVAYHEGEGADRARARPFVYQVAELARDVVGENLRNAALRSTIEEQKRPRDVVKKWLALAHPLLSRRPSVGMFPSITIYDVIDGLSALDAGEIQPLFKANTGKNRRPNRWSKARTKLDALAWKKRLVAMGVHDKEASFRVTVAFGEQWETIRKWRAQCEEILGKTHVDWELYYAGGETDPFLQPSPSTSGMFANSPRISPEEALSGAGAKYQRERTRAAELSKRKSRLG